MDHELVLLPFPSSSKNLHIGIVAEAGADVTPEQEKINPIAPYRPARVLPPKARLLECVVRKTISDRAKVFLIRHGQAAPAPTLIPPLQRGTQRSRESRRYSRASLYVLNQC